MKGCELLEDRGAEGGEWRAVFRCPSYYETNDTCQHVKEVTLFQSIPHSMWLSIVTFTTVGYGDIFPTTVASKVIGGIQCIVGMLTVALPATVIQANFSERFQELNARRVREENAFLTRRR